MTRRIWSRAVAGVVAGSFAAGLLVAGLFHLPELSQAQRPTQAQPVSAPPSAAGVASLTGLSDAFSAIADRVRPSVVYIESSQRQTVSEGSGIPPEFAPFF